MKSQWRVKARHRAKRIHAGAAAFAARLPRPSLSALRRILKEKGTPRSDGLLPYELVKYFAVIALLSMLATSLVLSWMISDNARKVLLKRSEAYSQLFADNLNRQVFLQFVLPTVVRYGRIALSDEKQYARLDQIVRNVSRGMRVDSVSIYDTRENRISYSTVTSLKGKMNMGGLEYRKAREGQNSTVLVSGGSLLSLLPGMPEVYCTLRTFVPFHQEDRLGKRTDEIMGVVEITQDLSEDLRTIIRLQASIIVSSLFVMAILSAILTLIVVKANRIMARRADERIMLEEELNRSKRLASLGKMVAAVSHEIKNPLGIVMSTAEILRKRISKVAPGNEHLAGIIVEETSRLDNIVREFLDFARPREVAMKEGSLNEVAERVIRFMEPEFAGKGIELKTDFSRSLPVVVMDDGQMYQVALNIAINAVHAMPEGGTLHFGSSLSMDGSMAILTIADTGIGMEESKLEQIFTPFYTEKNRGTGLGLAIARSIVEKHSGHLKVRSAVGEGSTFTIELPVQPDNEKSDAGPES